VLRLAFIFRDSLGEPHPQNAGKMGSCFLQGVEVCVTQIRSHSQFMGNSNKETISMMARRCHRLWLKGLIRFLILNALAVTKVHDMPKVPDAMVHSDEEEANEC
jgi:hypothetical protein